MQCARCHAENREGRRFCGECGLSFASTCPSCGFLNVGGEKFCGGCGRALVFSPGFTEVKLGSPQRYTPKHLAEKILTSKSALEGERKQVTVLFADLKGSMELLADRDPEEAQKLLDPVLERMMEAVHRYEGTVNQVMGDGIMALFGAPVAHEDHAVCACYAALDMQAAIRRYGEEVRRNHGVALHIRVGLNSGEVVVRAIGGDLHMDYTAVGQTTHLAARMEQLASPGGTLLAADTLRLAEGYVQVKPLGPVPVKGLDAPVEVYELVGAGLPRSRLQAAAARGLTRFVGRERELEELRQALGRAAAGHGQVAAIVGEPGVGKSRLVWEVTHSHRTHGWLTLQSSSVSYGKATPYLPVIDLLKAYFQIDDRDDYRATREKVSGKVLTLDESLMPTLPVFLALLNVPVDDPGWQALDPPERRRQTLDAVKRLLLRESRIQPLLVAVEDLHWIDGETQALLDSLAESVPTARVLLLLNYRPEYEHRWGNKTYYTQLRLDPLPPESAQELLGGLLGEDPALRPLKRLLIERTDGNPFFLEESVRTLVETQALAGERGSYRLTRDLPGVEVPATVQAVLAARIDRLPPDEKRLLLSAAVIGKDVPFALLRAIAELPEEALRRGLTHLQAAEFLYETSLFPDLEYTFKHALTHEVAYGCLLQHRRRALHARIVEAIERLHPDRLAAHVDRLAAHAFRGEVWDKALTYLRQAGATAMARSALREAVANFEQALVALQHLPESRETVEQAIDLRLNLRNGLLPLGEYDRVLEHLREAERLAEGLGDQQRLGWVSAHRSRYLAMMGDQHGAIESGRRALSIAVAIGDLALQVIANLFMSYAPHNLGEYRQAIDLLTGTVAALDGNLVRERFGLAFLPSVVARTRLAYSLAECGQFAEGIVTAEEGVRIAGTADRVSRIFACGGLGYLRLRKGDIHEAVRVLEESLGTREIAELPFVHLIATPLGYAYALTGRVADGLRLLAQGVEQAAATRRMERHSLDLGWLSEAYLLAGEADRALALAERGLDLSCQQQERGHEAWLLRLLGEIASHRDPWNLERAEDCYRHAMALAEQLGMRPLIAHCHLGLGKLYRRTGQRDQARENLTTSTARYCEMDMQFWLKKAEAELRTLA
jgi:class 3 adenylate cyclase/tetratricopeptide (TPR) repeat protein